MDNDFLEECLALRELPMDVVKERLSISDQHIDHEGNYEKLKGLTEFRNAAAHPGFFYYRDGVFVLLYIGAAEELDQIDPESLEKTLGEPADKLRSRAGKHFIHNVYPEQGIAFSSDGSDLRILEIFPPTTLDAYRKEIYKKPRRFIR
jgi:hypothetical protein